MDEVVEMFKIDCLKFLKGIFVLQYEQIYKDKQI